MTILTFICSPPPAEVISRAETEFRASKFPIAVSAAALSLIIISSLCETDHRQPQNQAAVTPIRSLSCRCRDESNTHPTSDCLFAPLCQLFNSFFCSFFWSSSIPRKERVNLQRCQTSCCRRGRWLFHGVGLKVGDGRWRRKVVQLFERLLLDEISLSARYDFQGPMCEM